MKRLKSKGISLCSILLAAVLFFGGTGLATFARTKADTPAPLVPVTSTEVFAGQADREVELGHSFDVPTVDTAVAATMEIIVKAPNGQTVVPNNNTVMARQLGNYTVEARYKATQDEPAKTAYSYNVYCSMTQEYTVYVDFDGATIPNYMGVNDTFTVPNVFLGYTDEDGVIREYDPNEDESGNDISDFTVTLEGAKRDFNTETRLVKATAHGTLVLKYSITIADGKHYSKEFTINVQEGYDDKSVPKLGVVNVPRTANVNTKVSLPIATATATSDERVQVLVTVRLKGLETTANPDGDAVLLTEDDIDPDTGYAKPREDGYKNNKAIKFDNIRTTSFYPTLPGIYKVSYTAVSDNGKPSTTHNYEIEVSDSLAPVFVNFDRQDIPTKWGLSVKNKADESGSKKTFSIPIPDVRDNADNLDDLTLVVRILDPESRTVLRFTNALDAINSGTGTGHEATNTRYNEGTKVSFDENGIFEFDINKYKYTDSTGTNTPTGTYTVDYRVVDSKDRGRTFSPAITFSVASSFEDTKAPIIDQINAVQYILLGEDGDETLEIPTAIVSDDNDTNPNIKYTLKFTPESGAATSVVLDKAQTLDIVKDGSAYKLVNDKEEALLTIGKGKIVISCVATDDAGNESEIQSTKPIGVYLKSEQEQVKLNLSHSDNFLNYGEISRVTNVNGTDTLMTEVPLGNFSIEVDDAKFAGFEILLKNSKGAIVSLSLERMIVGNTIYVKNLMANIKQTGEHNLYIRLFDITGQSKLFSYTFTIAEDGLSTEDPLGQSAIVPTSGALLNTRYTFEQDFLSQDSTASTFAVIRVAGNSFSLIGNEFIANSDGKYNFVSYRVTINKESNPNFDYAQSDLRDPKKFSTQVASNEKPVIELLDSMPVYSEKKTSLVTNDRYTAAHKGTLEKIRTAGWVVLPSVTAFNKNGNAKVEIEIKDRDSNTSTIENFKLYQNKDGSDDYAFFESAAKATEAGYVFTNIWAFAPHLDGRCTITYKATADDAPPAELSFTIRVGKIAGPTVDVTKTARTSYAIGAKFEFYKIATITDVGYESYVTNYKITKKLIAPDGTTIEVSGRDFDKYADMKDNNGTTITLSQSGTYTEVYEVEDSYGNVTSITNSFQVNSESKGFTSSMKMLSVILVIVAILLLAGAVFYVVKFRKVKRIKK